MGIFDFYKKKRNLKSTDAYKEMEALLTPIIGTEEKPAKVENKKLRDGSIYSGEAILCTDGYYQPNGYGKKILNKNVEMTGKWVNGVINGVCYMNMHFAMVTGQFKNNHPKGWCLSVEGGKGYVFGYFDNDDCQISLGEEVKWMYWSIHSIHLYKMFMHNCIVVGERIGKEVIGFHFMDNGDVYVGTEDAAKVEKTGYFFKFTHEGYLQTGQFQKGKLIKKMTPYDVVKANQMDTAVLPNDIDTNRKYF